MKVLVTRARQAGEATAERLRERGHVPVLLPLFETRDTGARLPNGSFEAVIFTSAAAIEILTARLEGEWSRLLDLPVFCVGEATAKAARQAGFRQVLAGPGTAAALVETIAAELADTSASRRLLYLAPQDRAFDLADDLRERGMNVEEIMLYRAERVDPGAEALANALHECAGGAALVYSPRAAKHLVGLAAKYAMSGQLAGLTLIAISENVARAIAGSGLPEVLVSEMPQEDGLFTLLDRLDRNGRASPRNDEDNEEGHH